MVFHYFMSFIYMYFFKNPLAPWERHFFFTESNILTIFSSALWGKKSWWTTFQFDFFFNFQRIFLLFFLYSRAHCEIEKWLVRLSGTRSGTVTAGSQGRYHLPCLSFVIFFWKCKCKLGFWREAEAVSPALSEICVTRNKNNHFWWKCCWTCQTSAQKRKQHYEEEALAIFILPLL